jgi:hypothetical protein
MYVAASDRRFHAARANSAGNTTAATLAADQQGASW